MSEKTTLSACPFCGGEAYISALNESGWMTVECLRCGAKPFDGSYPDRAAGRKDLADRWNRRERPAARLLTPREIRETKAPRLCWWEWQGDRTTAPQELIGWRERMEFGMDMITDVAVFSEGSDSMRDYGRIWRLWTDKPTDEQRQETPWKEANGDDEGA